MILSVCFCALFNNMCSQLSTTAKNIFLFVFVKKKMQWKINKEAVGLMAQLSVGVLGSIIYHLG